jgi:uncharacterized coiled-coil protein SlyX
MRAAHTVILLASALAGAACAAAPPVTPATAPSPAPSAGRATAPAQRPAPSRTGRDTTVVTDPELERRLARLELRLLERDAQVEDLQARLDESRNDIVRTLAKLQSSASRAEAASGVAEAELVLQTLKSGAGAQAPSTALVASMVQQGSAEFNKQNYGGALYLANQAKALASTYAARNASAGGAHPRPGETMFALPVHLKVASRANVREGPGTSYPVVFSADAGAVLTGVSYVDEWIRIAGDDGRTGWIFRTLIVKP